jgi:hypothetical protein
MNKVACFILSYEITKGMKSFGPIGLLKANASARELILYQIDSLYKIFDNPDIFIVSGFGSEKLDKKLPEKIGTIVNSEYENKNHGYALKLILSKIDTGKYSGCFIVNSGTLIKNTGSKNTKLPFNNSWILSQKNKKHPSRTKYMGAVTNERGNLDYIFYDIGNHVWCDSFYLCKQDIAKLKLSINSFYDNMFLFEIINRSISNHQIQFSQVVLPPESISIITGMKDKHKIKE